MTILAHSLATVTIAASLVACVKPDETPAELRTAIPTSEQVTMKLPDTSSRTIGELAQWYVATRNVTRTFNGGTAWVLILIHSIVQFPVTSVDGDTYTWGPWSDGALAPAEYQLDVTDNGDGTYAYALSGRSKTDANAAFEDIISGIADTSPGELLGNGAFQVDFDASRRVNPVDAGDERGAVEVSYDLAARHLDLGISSTDDAGNPVSAEYSYNDTVDGAGDMTFTIDGNAGETALNEQIVLRSRWLATGAGRADARISGGDLGTVTAMASECWSSLFRRTFYTDSHDFAPTEGAATDCAFANVDLPPAN